MNKKREAPRLVDPRLVKSLADPTRAHALNILNQRPSSPGEIAKELEIDVGLVDHHIKELRNLGVVDQIAQRGVDGAKANVYKANIRQFFDADAWAQVPGDRRLGVTMSILGLISGDIVHAYNGGTLEERPDSHLSRIPMTLDEEGWKEVVDLLEQALEELLAIQVRATNRMANSGEEPMLTKVSIIHFNSPPGPRG